LCHRCAARSKALAWEYIDLENVTINIKYNIDRKGKLKPPKIPASIRHIELLPKAMEVIKRQIALTLDQPTILETVDYKYGHTKFVKRHRVFLNRENQPINAQN
jgi:integrase